MLAETGTGYFHTEVGRLQKVIREDVLAGNLTSESDLLDRTKAAYSQAAASTGTSYKETDLDKVLLSNQAVVHKSTDETITEMKAEIGASQAEIDEAYKGVDDSFSDPDVKSVENDVNGTETRSSDNLLEGMAAEPLLSVAINKVVEKLVPEKYQDAAKALAPIAAKGVYELGKVAAKVGVRGTITLITGPLAKAFATLTATVEVGAAGTAAVTGAAIVAAAGAVTWAVEDTKRALKGEKTMTDVATETYNKAGFVGTMQALWWGIKN